jgi:hypothetical protein
MNNRRRDTPRSSSVPLIAILLGAGIAAAGGVLHAYYKNLQVSLSREIDGAERRIEQRRLEIRTSEMRMDQLLNRFVIRQQLEENGSALRPITQQAIEDVTPTPPARRSVASASSLTP